MRKYVYLDFETRSQLDIKKFGGVLYAEHPSTSILCLAYAKDMAPPVVLTVKEINVLDAHELYDLAKDPNVIFVAHNAAFEQAIWKNHMVPLGFPEIPIERWKDTMAKAFAHGLPGDLERVAKVLGLDEEKDSEGHKVMLKLSKPKKDGTFYEYYDCPEDFEKLYAYCPQDVRVTQRLDVKLRDLSPHETVIWRIDQRMNQEGVYVDVPLVQKAIALVDRHKQYLEKRCDTLLGFKPTQRQKLLAWFQSRGVKIKDTQATTLNKLLDDQSTPPVVREVIALVNEANKTSLAKYAQMLKRSTADGLMRENLMYHAAHTGRWGGRGAQLQNLPRPKEDISGVVRSVESFHDKYETFVLLHNDVSKSLSSMLRGAIIAPPGYTLFVGDLSQMEARVIAWLAGEDAILELFRNGEDIYSYAASQIYGFEVTKKSHPEERQVGKVAVLALGYGGGIGAFATMAKGYEVDLRPVYPAMILSSTPGERERAAWAYAQYIKRCKKNDTEPVGEEEAFVSDIIKQRWRIANSNIQGYWGQLESAATYAVRTGEPIDVGAVRFFTHEEFLYCRLPSGRRIVYPFPKLREKSRGGYELSYRGLHNNQWTRVTTYGGKLAENITQAVQRDLLADATLRLDDKYPAVLHVHDEIISVVPENRRSEIENFIAIMREVPQWAQGIPIDANGWAGERYGKE